MDDEDLQVVDGLEVEDDFDDEIEEETLPSLDYKVANGHIAGYVDGREAMIQAIDKIAKTDRFTYPIYSDQYGNDLQELFGKDFDYAKVEVERMLEEAFLADDRVNSVTVDDIRQTDSTILTVTASVDTIYGTVPVESEVAIESDTE
ncbi:DUF2634 domain-containing protein [Secundilactobacillus kimchicus]|uniref:DUF2634 domain-containing protein n=1 Tax=Secundilactobacillus kimchicus TaxID=528209 RepID=UPI001C00DA20|nr:DUF2634 domain-containing protein [Secundilactobacillus kimchicus]MBT9671748.1 DUF2634 domain-containing protein [Secundilactobacillus kimchicus]